MSKKNAASQIKESDLEKPKKNPEKSEVKLKAVSNPDDQDQSSLKSQADSRMEDLKVIQAKKLQMLRAQDKIQSPSSLEINLMQSEGLKLAQEKIVELEKELDNLRYDNEKLVSALDTLKEQQKGLITQLEDTNRAHEEEKLNFNEEKEILLTTLQDAKKKIEQLSIKKTELKKRLSQGLQNILVRENSLQDRLELLKLDSSILQREKDNKIINLQKQLNKLNESLQSSYKKNKGLQEYIDQLKDTSRKTVSVLRATMHNLEGHRTKEFLHDHADSSEEDEK